MEKHLNIGFFLKNLNNKYEQEITKGIINACKEIDANLYLFASSLSVASANCSMSSDMPCDYNTIFTCADKSTLDILIVSISMLGAELSQNQKKLFLQQFDGIEVVTINQPVEGYSCVSTDNFTGLVDGINHIIRHHNKNKIGYVTGQIGNYDAMQRLMAYKTCLVENRIPFNEKLIAYGDFSHNCGNVIEELLDRNPDIEAVVFGNDLMAVTGYEIFEERNIKVGKDILVMGFDNSPNAWQLYPLLTTVECNTELIGYNAVIEAKKSLGTGQVFHKTINSRLLLKGSCGCENDYIEIENILQKNKNNNFVDTAFSIMDKYIFQYFYNVPNKEDITVKYKRFISCLYDLTNQILHTETSSLVAFKNELFTLYEQALDSEISIGTEINRQFDILMAIRNYFLELHSCDKDGITKLDNIFIELFHILASKIISDKQIKSNNSHILLEQSNEIIKKLVSVNDNIDSYYCEALTTLAKAKINKAYIYKFDKPINYIKFKNTHSSDNIQLVAYLNEGKSKCVYSKNIIIPTINILNNSYVDTGMRNNMVVCSLNIDNVYYGLMMIETDIENNDILPSIFSQMSVAMRIMYLNEKQTKTQKKLKKSLKKIQEKNNELETLSVIDVLTGINNRRGFYDKVENIITDDKNAEKNAIVVYADLDFLKTINDKFGHEQGDFAIKSAADILKKSFDENAVIGRLGGDEFAIFTFADFPEYSTDIKEKIISNQIKFNKFTGKPFKVGISFGIYKFECSSEANLNKILSEADNYLYEAKKHKSTIFAQNI